MTTLFISDLHLSEERPEISRTFFRFLDEEAQQAQRLYILGDFFDFWIGDDYLQQAGPNCLAKQVAVRLARLSHGVQVFFMHGNRDFLLGHQFMALSGMQLLNDPTLITLGQTATLLMHGDSLCTEDSEYMKFRALARSEAWKNAQLAKPLEERLHFARQLRESSQHQNQLKAEYILDVSEAEVHRVMQHHNVSQLIHGHTHRPQVHHYPAQNQTRYVLGDWDQQGGWYLLHDNSGLNLKTFK